VSTVTTPAGTTAQQHWNAVYHTKGPEQVSWFQSEPTLSLELIEAVGLAPADPIIDIGGGACPLAGWLLDRGYTDVTVLDVSTGAINLAKDRLGARAEAVRWETADMLAWNPPRAYALWHDRAVFHFLTDPASQARYRERVTAGLRAGGHLVLATFAADGPEHCSGLPVARYGPEQLATQFGPEFTTIATRREHHHTPTGADQPFTWLLLRRTTSG
jgi:trans-aconitate methyltransferase